MSLRLRRTLSLPVLLLVLLLVGGSFVSADTAEDIEAMATKAIEGFVNNDVDALRPLLLEGCVAMIEGVGYAPGALVMTAADALAMMATVPPGPVGEVKVTLDEDASQLEPDVAFAVGKVTGLALVETDLRFVAAAVNVEGEWRIAAIGAIPDETATDKLDAAGEALVKALGEGETTGMQAALAYLPVGPSMFIVGGPQFLITLAGNEQIRTQVRQWALPTDVVPGDDTKAIVGKDLAFVFRTSTFVTDDSTRESSDLLFLNKQAGAWKVVGFIARSVAVEDEVEGAEAEEADEAEEVEDDADEDADDLEEDAA